MFHELLFRHLFETQIYIQTQIRKNLVLALAADGFLEFLSKYRKELPKTKLLTKNKSPEIHHFVDNLGCFSDITTT